MSDPAESPFLIFLEAGVQKGGFETDDVLAAMVPLMKQTWAAHRAGMVAPLDGINEIVLTDQGQLNFVPAKAKAPEKNFAKIEALQTPGEPRGGSRRGIPPHRGH